MYAYGDYKSVGPAIHLCLTASIERRRRRRQVAALAGASIRRAAFVSQLSQSPMGQLWQLWQLCQQATGSIIIFGARFCQHTNSPLRFSPGAQQISAAAQRKLRRKPPTAVTCLG